MDFEKELGERVFIAGGKETVMTIYSDKEIINKYFKEHRNCSLQFEEMSILMKLLFIKESEQSGNEYVVKMRYDSVNIKEKNNQMLYELDLYVNELKTVESKAIKEESNHLQTNNLIIDHEKIIKLMKNNREIRKTIKSKSIKKKENNRQLSLSSNSFRLLDEISDGYNNEYYMPLFINSTSINEVVSYLCLEKEVMDIYPKLKNVLFSIKDNNNSRNCKRNLRESRSIIYCFHIIISIYINY